jgi:FkbM family methyltransferase
MKKNVFLDCGGHYGEGLMEFVEKFKMDSNWIIESFEPNPACDYNNRVSKKVKSHKLNITVHKKAVWIYDGVIAFSQENIQRSNSKSPNDGTSTIDGWGSVITELNSTHLNYCEPPILVDCVDFNSILKKYDKNTHNVIVKLDIEGAEYTLLRHLISNKTASNISQLYVEWHHVDLETENIETTQGLVKHLQGLGIKVYNWK